MKKDWEILKTHVSDEKENEYQRRPEMFNELFLCFELPHIADPPVDRIKENEKRNQTY